jgi:hypothetical protein
VSIDVTGAAWLDAEVSSNRHGYFLYLADVRGGAVEKVTPVARIDDRVFGRLMVGKTLEGLASARIPDGGSQPYEYLNRTVPIRLRFDDALPTSSTDSDTQFPRYALGGSIENPNGGVRASDGGCFPALSSLGERNPMFSAMDSRVLFHRHPNMHGGGDDVFTLEWPQGISAGSNMGGGLFIPVSALIQAKAPAPTEAHSAPHGTPWSAPSADLSVVSGGGATCTP